VREETRGKGVCVRGGRKGGKEGTVTNFLVLRAFVSLGALVLYVRANGDILKKIDQEKRESQQILDAISV
jgi:hypothetical protein